MKSYTTEKRAGHNTRVSLFTKHLRCHSNPNVSHRHPHRLMTPVIKLDATKWSKLTSLSCHIKCVAVNVSTSLLVSSIMSSAPTMSSTIKSSLVWHSLMLAVFASMSILKKWTHPTFSCPRGSMCKFFYPVQSAALASCRIHNKIETGLSDLWTHA